MGVMIQASDGGTTVFGNDVIAELDTGLHGALLAPFDAGYDEARTVWNAMIDRRPGLIVRCADAGDVARGVQFAHKHHLVLSVRGGGHNIAGSAVCDGGLMLDLTPMKTVDIDAATRTARVGPGVTLGEFDAAAQAHGLATPLGINSTTGVAGLTLGGGFGWLSRRLGMTVDNLLSADVVLATGEIVHASADENPDLFWAIRGGGGNFGVVTSFEFRLHPVGPELLAGLVIHPLDDAADVLRFHREFMKNTPDEFVCWFVMRKAPPLPFLPVEWHGREILALAMCHAGSIAEGERVAEPLRRYGRPIADVVSPHAYTAWQTALDPLLTPGARNYWKTQDFREMSDGAIDTLVDYARRIPDPQTEIACAQLGGAVERVAPEATAYTHRDGRFVLNIHGRWADPALDAACIAWARDLSAAVAPFATGGAYVNFMTQEETERIPAAYGSNYTRLVQLKQRFDPENLFNVNQNIRPALATAPRPV